MVLGLTLCEAAASLTPTPLLRIWSNTSALTLGSMGLNPGMLYSFFTEYSTALSQTVCSVYGEGDSGLANAERHSGFTFFDPNGSVVHSGENLINRNRFTAALFSQPF